MSAGAHRATPRADVGTTATSIPAEDERLDVAATGPLFVLPPAGIDLEAFRPDLVAFLGSGESGSATPRVVPDRHRGGRIRFEVVIPRRGFFTAPVGRDHGQAGGGRDP